MKAVNFLNRKATRVFANLIKAMQGKEHLKIYSEGYMPLTIECIDKNVVTPFGMGKAYSLCHYYEQNGDLMQDPEMCFYVLDNVSQQTVGTAYLKIIPYYFLQANVGLSEVSVDSAEENYFSFYPKMQKAHADFANLWLSNIEEQGFLTPFNNGNEV